MTAATPASGPSAPSGPAGSAGPARIALIGTHGFGASHLRTLARLEEEGVARLVGVVDVTEPPAELQAIHHRSLGELLDAASDQDRPEIVIIATPIDTHVPLATEALAAGLDVYLEKPPVPALAELQQLEDAARAVGRSVQVGFQARGGAGVDLLRDEVANGALGQVDTVQVYGAWQRDRAYYRRSTWAGRRRLNGRRVADGVATNPLAHSVHAGLVIAGIEMVSDIRSVTTELRRAHDIEADDTTFLRIDPVGDGPAVICALTTAAPSQSSPWIDALGTTGTHRLFYTEDVSRRTESAEAAEAGADGAGPDGAAAAGTDHGTAEGTTVELSHERLDLLENLIAHVRDRSVDLLSSLASTGAFSAVLEAIQSAPDPTPIPAEAVRWQGEGDAAHPVIEDIEQALSRALAEGRPFSELGVSWADEDAIQVWTPPAS